MAKQVQKSGLTQRYGERLRKAHESHKEDETEFDTGGRLPAGIENGTAQLVEAGFGQYKKGEWQGEYYFRAAAVVETPEEYRGTQTSIMEPICDTPGRKRATIDDHVKHVYNWLRLLGVDTTELEFEDLEDTVKALKDSDIKIRYRTWKGEKATTGPYAGREPRVQEVWLGAISSNGQAESATTTTDDVDDQGDDDKEAEPAKKSAVSEDTLIRNLAEAADEGDVKSQKKLSTMAKQAGIDPDAVDTWSEVADQMLGGAEASDDGGAEDEVVPEKGSLVKYKPAGSKKSVECEVRLVDEDEKTVTLKNLDDGKTLYKNVAWDELEESE